MVCQDERIDKALNYDKHVIFSTTDDDEIKQTYRQTDENSLLLLKLIES